MLVKVSAQSDSLEGACRKMNRALREFRIRGVKTNIPFLLNIISHPTFVAGKSTVNFIQDNPDLFKLKTQQDRATKAVKFLGNVVVNGNPDVKFIDENKKFETAHIPIVDPAKGYTKGTKDLLTELGPEGFANWLKNEKKITIYRHHIT